MDQFVFKSVRARNGGHKVYRNGMNSNGDDYGWEDPGPSGSNSRRQVKAKSVRAERRRGKFIARQWLDRS